MFSKSFANKIVKKAVRFSSSTNVTPRQVVVVDGVRTPFKRSSTDFDNLKAYDLGRIAIKGLMDKTALKPSDVDYVSFGTVIQEVKTHNLARECALGAGLLKTTPAHTVSMACISSNQAITTAAEKILSGRADVVLAGGAETMSDAPIRYNEKMRKRLIGAGKAMKKGPVGGLKHFSKDFSLKELVPEAPAVANFITGEVMGHSADRLAAKFGISREAQDKFAKKSHDSAAEAHTEGLLKSQIVPVNGNSEDNGVRGGSPIEDYQKLKPAFIKPHGTITAANASFMSDGASCSLIMSNTKAEELGMKPMAILKDWNYHAVDPFEELLLAPAFCIAQILKDNDLTIDDVGVWEIHEAFAGQVLANLAALASDEFSASRFDGYDKAVGKIPHDQINNWGGSLSIGHPFGATGSRLVTNLANRLQRENKKYGICAACADSGLGNATLLENPDV